MKKIVVLLFLLFSTTVMAQNPNPSWTTLRETSITVANGSTNYAYDIFTNGAGNHIIVQEPTALKYYKVDIYGTTIINLNPPLESTAVTSPSISGDLTKLYVVYRKGTENKIRTKYSTDGGVSWSYILPDLNTSSAPSSIECVFSKGNLHVTFLVGTTVYFNYYNTTTTPPSWLTQSMQVSDNTPPNPRPASNPRITINNAGSVDTVYFTFNEPTYLSLRWRRYIVGGALQNIQPVNTGYGFINENLGHFVDNAYIYVFSKNSSTSIFSWTIRRIWNNFTIVLLPNTNGNIYVNKIFSTTTANDTPYTAAWSTLTSFPNRIVRMGSNYSPDFVYDLIYANPPNLTPVNIVNLSAAGNDVHVVWKDNLGSNNGNNLRYKYYDDVPIPPQNLIITKSANNHPLLSWNANPEPDLDHYVVYKSTGGWHSIYETTSNSYEDPTETYCTLQPPQFCEGTHDVFYYVNAVDIGSHVSDASNTVKASVSGQYPDKITATPDLNETEEYSLWQNYPNPFNPNTAIDYSIKSKGLVTLKVYDMLGTEVAELVNENKEAGNYSVDFNASGLPSGIYFYTLTSGNFTASKKLILLK